MTFRLFSVVVWVVILLMGIDIRIKYKRAAEEWHSVAMRAMEALKQCQ